MWYNSADRRAVWVGKELKDFVEYIHVKDTKMSDEGHPVFVMAGEGDGYVREVLTEVLKSGYAGGISMEPHLSIVVHDKSVVSTEEMCYNSYIDFAKHCEKMLKEIENEIK